MRKIFVGRQLEAGGLLNRWTNHEYHKGEHAIEGYARELSKMNDLKHFSTYGKPFLVIERAHSCGSLASRKLPAARLASLIHDCKRK